MELQPHYLIIKHDTFPLRVYHPGDGGVRSAVPDSMRQTDGWRTRASRYVPAGIDCQRVGNELRVAERTSGGGAQSRQSDCWLPSKHGRGRRIVVPLKGRRSGVAGRDGDFWSCREPDGRFSMARLKDTIARAPQIRAIEIKLSQGAKPGVGGLLPRAKVSREIAAIRGIPMDRDCISPAAHSAFRNADEMLDFIEWIAGETGLPVGIKSAVGDSAFWEDLARLMAGGTRGVDFITIDGGEGGTGAGPLVFTDHVALPFKVGFSRVQKIFTEHGLNQRILFIGSGKLGFPEAAVFAFALGCDAINVGREAMMAIGCIQAQRCHTNHCPTGVATQHRWLVRGVDPTSKAARLANYIITMRKDVLALSRACGVPHPTLITADQLELLDDRFGAKTIAETFGYGRGFGLPSPTDCEEVRRLMNA